MEEDKKFASKEDLEDWLKSRGADDEKASKAARKLYTAGYDMPSTLLGATAEELAAVDLSRPIARHLSNKLHREEKRRPGYPFTDCIYILYFTSESGVIVPVSTSFAVTDRFALTAGHTVSEKSEEGTVQQIDQPFFLAKVLCRENGMIQPETAAIPVNIKKFHFDHDWAVLERTDNAVFPQVIPVALSPDQVPHVGVSDQLTFYHCPIGMLLSGESDRMHVTPKTGSVGLIIRSRLTFKTEDLMAHVGGRTYIWVEQLQFTQSQ